jgi:superfamily II DNA or RNA helicase
MSPDDIIRIVGAQAYERGAHYASDGHVQEMRWFGAGTQLFGTVHGNRATPYTVVISFASAASKADVRVSGTCTCPMAWNCKHVAALLIVSQQAAWEDSAGPSGPSGTEWRRALAPLAQSTPVERILDPLGLQFSLLAVPRETKYSTPVVSAAQRLGVRPVTLGKQGRWVRGQLSWSSVGYTRGDFKPDHLRILTSLLAISASSGHYLRYDAQWLYLDSFPSRALWELLAEARSSGLALIYDGKGQQPITVETSPATLDLDITSTADGLVITPMLLAGGMPIGLGQFGFTGNPAHGVFAWEDPGSGPQDVKLTLARLPRGVSPEIRDFALSHRAISVPRTDEQAFVSEFLPHLSRAASLTSRDGSFDFPQNPVPNLVLTITHHPRALLSLAWGWEYCTSGTTPPAGAPAPGSERRLWPSGPETAFRDRDSEAAVLDSIDTTLQGFPELFYEPMGQRRLGFGQTLGGVTAIEFLTNVVPVLQAHESVIVRSEGAAPDYRRAAGAPSVSLTALERPDSRDWFDLTVTVTIDDEAVPFDSLFRALAAGDEIMVLPSGTYFTLDRPELQRLRHLIEEARGLQESATESLGLSRFQTDLWAELESLGVVDAQAAAWRDVVSGLAEAAEVTPQVVPDGVNATLRAYQQTGFDWLCFLHDHRLGGILADDMGLGKTLQAIALVARAREQGSAPFLVVAPTSVVSNWAAECSRFAPELSVVTISETSAKRMTSLVEAAGSADIVITSYTLFRLDFDEVDAIDWAGLVLDEAQFVKNHRSAAHQCARRLRAPLKIAITGTPLENNLMELWSLLSITAPGLFPSPTRFAEYYQKPIERDLDADRLAQLRRRMRPFMLRRTKEQVASDLPAKQEQVLELELHPKHRKVYDTHLQRERTKVLRLIDDMNANRFEIFRSLTMLRQLSLDASLYDDRYAAIPSTKLDALTDLLTDIVAEGHRTLIFSQFTTYLKKARSRLDEAGIPSSYLDGRTRNRAKAIADFKDGSNPVFLISLKAGGFGLNLTEADFCILLDPWWNPATEAQAVDRVHRIGQTRKVMVYRMVSKDTIEEKVMALKASKAQLFDSVMEGAAGTGSGLSASDIRDLLS